MCSLADSAEHPRSAELAGRRIQGHTHSTKNEPPNPGRPRSDQRSTWHALTPFSGYVETILAQPTAPVRLRGQVDCFSNASTRARVVPRNKRTLLREDSPDT